MWQRSDLKQLARQNLQNKYWWAFAVTILVGILSSGNGIFSYSFNAGDLRRWSNRGKSPFGDSFDQFFDGSFNWDTFGEFNRFWSDFNFSGVVAIFFFIVFFAFLIGLAYGIFVAPVIQVGGNRWFSRSRESAATPSVGQVFSLFKSGRYLKTVGSMLWMNLFLFLWSLLALIPVVIGLSMVLTEWLGAGLTWMIPGDPSDSGWFGQVNATRLLIGSIILSSSALFSIPVVSKQYAYRMTPWILADNPQIGYKRALKLSIDLTRGHKWRIFVLDLSFIGWFLLGVLACGIGVAFVMPYYVAVQAELYARLRQHGSEQGLCTMEELGFRPVTVPDQANLPV